MDNTDIRYMREFFTLKVENPMQTDPGRPILESAVANMLVRDVQAVYPLIRALNSDKLTRNNTLYERKALIGNKNTVTPTGYSSWVLPHPKPIITEHNLQGGLFNSADKPLGRIMYATYKKHPSSMLLPAGKGLPGFVEGSGAMYFVPCISDQEAIPKILGGAYHTVSVGSMAGKIIESITGADLVQLRRQGKELPPFQKGDWVEMNGEKKLSFWSLSDLSGLECSYVNCPSDTHAFNEDPNIGEDGIRLLVGEKKVGQKEYSFYDMLTLEKIMDLAEEEHAVFANGANFVDSNKIPEYYFLNKGNFNMESVQEPKEKVEEAEVPVTKPLFEKEDFINYEGKLGKVIQVNEEFVWAREIKEGSITLNIHKIEVAKAEKTENPDMKDELKEFFMANFKPNDKFEKESPLAGPLLALREQSVWSEIDRRLAASFKSAYEKLEDKETLKIWGIAKPLLLANASKISETITKVLNNGKT